MVRKKNSFFSSSHCVIYICFPFSICNRSSVSKTLSFPYRPTYFSIRSEPFRCIIHHNAALKQINGSCRHDRCVNKYRQIFLPILFSLSCINTHLVEKNQSIQIVRADSNNTLPYGI